MYYNPILGQYSGIDPMSNTSPYAPGYMPQIQATDPTPNYAGTAPSAPSQNYVSTQTPAVSNADSEQLGSLAKTGMSLAGDAALPYAAPATLGLGILQAGMGLYGLSQMGARPNYTQSGALTNSYNRAETMAQHGFSAPELINAQNNIQQTQNTSKQAALDAGGGQLSGVINGALGSTQVGANNQLAASDAAAHRANIVNAQGVDSEVQAQQNLATQNQIQGYDQKQQAYGGALSSGLTNTATAVNQIPLNQAQNNMINAQGNLMDPLNMSLAAIGYRR